MCGGLFEGRLIYGVTQVLRKRWASIRGLYGGGGGGGGGGL